MTTKILLVEDNEMNRDMLSRRLQRKNYEIVHAGDGQQAITLAHAEAPDLILMDMSLPIMDGWEATKLLKQASHTQGIPVIALTAHAMAGDREKALAAGCDDYETKPVELPQLLRKIEALLARPKFVPETKSTEKDLIGEFKRDLRTLLNQVIGYSQMLQEQGEGEEFFKGSICDDIKRIEISGRQILSRIDEVLNYENLSHCLDKQLLELGTKRQILSNLVNANIDVSVLAPTSVNTQEPEVTLQEIKQPEVTLQEIKQPEVTLQEIKQPEVTLQEIKQPEVTLQEIKEPEVTLQEIKEPEVTLQKVVRSEEVKKIIAQQIPLPAATLEQEKITALLTHSEKTICGNILVVDDNEANRDVLGRRLERQGHQVTMAENGRQALEKIRQQVPDLVLLDVMMPEMDGYQTLEALKSDKLLRHIPVIMITALDQIESLVKCIDMGAEDYLPKPFDPVILRARIDACLEKKLLRDQEIEYLLQVNYLTQAAADIEAKKFTPESIAPIAMRDDSLGQLARVFQHMAQEVNSREQRLKQQVQLLRIAIDEAKKSRIVSEVAETQHFQEIKKRAQKFRSGTESASS